MLPFNRILVEDNDQLSFLVIYIHRNPIHHGFTDVYSSWQYTSYNSIINNIDSKFELSEILKWFEGINDFVDIHKANKIDSKSNKIE